MPRDSDTLHLFHCSRKSGLRTRRGECDRHRLGNRFRKLPKRHFGDNRDGDQNANDKRQECGIKRGEQLEKVHENAQPHMSHRVGYGCAHADWRKHHDDVCELEHRFRQTLAEGKNGLAFTFLNQSQRNREDDAEDYDLKDLTFEDDGGE